MNLNLLKHIPPEIREKYQKQNTGPISDPQKESDVLNSLDGDLTGYDCPQCKNKGVIYLMDGNYVVSRECECMAVRRARALLQNSGLSEILKEYRLDNYKTGEKWQREFKSGAIRYLNDHDRKWFFAGGQPGVGKTHICTAMAAQFLEQGVPVRYMVWKEETTRIKGVINDESEYSKIINTLQSIPVLYIDDLFRPTKDDRGMKRPPTPGDINIAWDILNHRYINNLPTIISTERTIDELIDIDEAIGSRIYQRTKAYCFSFDTDRLKNYRLTGEKL